MDKRKFRIVENYPKKGIKFIDITPILQDGDEFHKCIDELERKYKTRFNAYDIDAIVAIESRGFIFGAALAERLGVGFIPVRKEGKLPYETIKGEYSLEYGKDVLEMHTDSIKTWYRVLVVDDILATGGTAECVCEMVERLGGEVVGCLFVAELEDLGGAKRLKDKGIYNESLCSFTDEYLNSED